ncbi:glycosyltransferase [Roseomonas fluvialis]|nr:glycosyltransferase [Roseomonas fluvialis]
MTNICLTGRTGTELVTVECALRLVAGGDTVAVYTPEKGATAGMLLPRGVMVTDRIRDLDGFAPDLLHGHHNTPFLVARAAFPDVPATWSCHDFRSVWDRPPPAHTAQVFVAHSTETAQRLRIEGGVAEARIRMLPNAADLAACSPPAVPPTPRSALLVGKGGAPGAFPALAEALIARGWQVTSVGRGLGETVSNLPDLMAAHAVVVSSGRAALEALGAGCAVVCADARGLAGLVTTENFHALRRRNFGGATLLRPLDPALVLAEIDAIDAGDQAALRALAVPEIGLDLYMERLRAIHAEAIALAGQPSPGDAMRGAETMEAMLASPRPGGFGPTHVARLREEHAARLARVEGEAARLALRLRLATLKPGERLRIAEWRRGPGAALLGAGWARGDGGRVAIAGRAQLDLSEAMAQRRIARIVLHLACAAPAPEGAVIEVLDGARVIATVPAQGLQVVVDLDTRLITAEGAKAFALCPRGETAGWALAEAELVPEAPPPRG